MADGSHASSRRLSLNPGRQRIGPNVAALLKGIRHTALLLWVLLIPGALGPVVQQVIAQPGPLMIGTTLLVVHHVGTGILLWRHDFTVRAVASSGLLLLAGIIAMMPWRSTIDPSTCGRRATGRVGSPARPGQQVTLSGAADRMTAVVLAPSRSQQMRWARIFTVGSMPGEQVQVDADEDFARITVQRPAAVLGPVRGTSAW